jgi:hypothetical protein
MFEQIQWRLRNAQRCAGLDPSLPEIMWAERYAQDVAELLRMVSNQITLKATCDVHGCEAPATCIIGCGEGHPSCDYHAQGADYIEPLADTDALLSEQTQ